MRNPIKIISFSMIILCIPYIIHTILMKANGMICMPLVTHIKMSLFMSSMVYFTMLFLDALQREKLL